MGQLGRRIQGGCRLWAIRPVNNEYHHHVCTRVFYWEFTLVHTSKNVTQQFRDRVRPYLQCKSESFPSQNNNKRFIIKATLSHHKGELQYCYKN